MPLSPQSLAPEEAIHAYRTIERRGSLVAAAGMAGLVLMWWLEAPLYLGIALLALVLGSLAVGVKRDSSLPRVVEALHTLGLAGGPAVADPATVRSEVRTRWWHLDNTFPPIWLAYTAVFAWVGNQAASLPVTAITIAVIAVFVAAEAYANPFMPRLPGVAMRLTPAGVELPKARLTLRWPEIDAIWPIPDSGTRRLGLALHLADPQTTLPGRRQRRAVARNGGCVLLRENWLQAPLVDLLRTAHAFKRASMEGS
ncbi:hypothetical protein AB0H43_35785 [Hamadaea sp. NPDC050747]|uniref:hypothetical protein n=1 Tax=Hamadaea sp. NPDC050747 TaxID=3155789 RepID=UPI0033FA79AC